MATIGTFREAVIRLPVEELNEHLATLEVELSQGKSIELVRGGTVIAEMRAPKQETVASQTAQRYIPDFAARMKEIWGDAPLDVDTTALIREDRDGRD